MTGSQDRPLGPAPVTLQALPRPANVTEFSYAGVAPRGTTAFPTGAFRFDISVHSGPPVTVSGIKAGFTGPRTAPAPPVSVPAGTTRRIGLEISVADCSGLPLNPDPHFSM